MGNAKALVAELEQGKMDKRLKDIYVDEGLLATQRERYGKAVQKFEETFGDRKVSIYSAPGRSEVSGNHTDHQRGKVLAASVNLDAIAVVSKTDDNMVSLLSEGYPMMEVDLGELEAKPEEKGTTPALVRGMASAFHQKDHAIGGFCAYVTSDVLGGAGLSSSAAFEVLIGTILSGEYNDGNVNPVQIAKDGQYAENVYFGKPCGLMDQMACSVGGLIHIDFKDPAKPHVEKVTVDFSSHGYSLCITDTKGSHADLTDDYAAVPAEMKQVATYFGKEHLRDVDPKVFYQNIAKCRENVGDRPVLRAMHFFEEEVRVSGIVDSLKTGKFSEFLSKVKASGQSSFQYLQNVYSPKDAQKQAVSLGLAVSEHVLAGGHGVTRVHGGGFAGTIQAFVKDDYVEQYRRSLDAVFGEGSCHVLKVRQLGGIKVA